MSLVAVNSIRMANPCQTQYRMLGDGTEGGLDDQHVCLD